jgi:CHAD domain-containing protein
MMTDQGRPAGTSHLEREVKLGVPPGFRMPELAGTTGDLVIVPDADRTLVTTYWDTNDLRLARWGCQLRHRVDDADPSALPWTVKLPVGGQGEALVRREHSFAGGPGLPPAAAVDLVRAYVRSAGLRPVATLRTLRRRLALADRRGEAAGEIVDDEVSALDGGDVATSFREVEIEAGSALDERTMGQVVARLREAGAGRPSRVPKPVRALGARAAGLPELVVPILGDAPTAADVVRVALIGSAIRLLRHDAGVRIGDDPEMVHQARVATRRLRSDLRSWRAFLDPDWNATLRGELRWLADALGAVRDADVLRERLESSAAGLPREDRVPAEALSVRLTESREAARDRLLGQLRSDRYVELLDHVVARVREPRVLTEANLPASEALAQVMQAPFAHVRTAFAPLGPDAPDEALHAARIRVKRVRYAAESLVPVVGKPARRFGRLAGALQDVLGEHQDAVVAERWLRDTAPALGGKEAFVAGELAAAQRADSDGTRRRWPDLWTELARKRNRFWT